MRFLCSFLKGMANSSNFVLFRKVPAGSSNDLRPAMVAMLADLKVFRTSLLNCSGEIDDILKKSSSLQEENSKLKYQIMHLKRSLEAEEQSKH